MKTKKVDRVFSIISIIITTIVLVAGLWVVGRLYKATTDYRYVEGTVITDVNGWITVLANNGERIEFDSDELQCGAEVRVKLDCEDTAKKSDDKYVSYTLLSESEE